MISMPKVQSIRRRRMNGESIASIARSENVSEPTVRKYLKAGDLSPRPPVKRKHAESAVGPLRAGDSGSGSRRIAARGASSGIPRPGYGSVCVTSTGRRCRCRP